MNIALLKIFKLANYKNFHVGKLTCKRMAAWLFWLLVLEFHTAFPSTMCSYINVCVDSCLQLLAIGEAVYLWNYLSTYLATALLCKRKRVW